MTDIDLATFLRALQNNVGTEIRGIANIDGTISVAVSIAGNLDQEIDEPSLGLPQNIIDKLQTTVITEVDLESTTHIPKECAICYSEYQVGENVRCLPCGDGKHLFHNTCIDPWLNTHNNCPMCRQTVLQDPELLRAYEEYLQTRPRPRSSIDNDRSHINDREEEDTEIEAINIYQAEARIISVGDLLNTAMIERFFSCPYYDQQSDEDEDEEDENMLSDDVGYDSV